MTMEREDSNSNSDHGNTNQWTNSICSEEARARKIQNEERRRAVWKSEEVRPNSSNDDSNIKASVTRSRPTLGSFLDQKQQIAGRSLRRLSSRRSHPSSSSSYSQSTRSINSAVSEKEAIAERSNRRIRARAAFRQTNHDDEIDLEEGVGTKAGTAELVLPTVIEQMGTEHSNRSSTTPPPVVLGVCYPQGEDLVMATIVDDEEQPSDFFVNDITYATEVRKEEEAPHWRRRLPVLLCCALVCLVAVNAVIIGIVMQTRDSSVIETNSFMEDAYESRDQGDTIEPVELPSATLAPSFPFPALENRRYPTIDKSDQPTITPYSNKPTQIPTSSPSPIPSSDNPTEQVPRYPKDSSAPTAIAARMTTMPSVETTDEPSTSSTDEPSAVVTDDPSTAPTNWPSRSFSKKPSDAPTSIPATSLPTPVPSMATPTMSPSVRPTLIPTLSPSFYASDVIHADPFDNLTEVPRDLPSGGSDNNGKGNGNSGRNTGSNGNGNSNNGNSGNNGNGSTNPGNAYGNINTGRTKGRGNGN